MTALHQPQVGRGVVHPVKQAVAGRAQHPDFVGPLHVLSRATLSKALVSRTVSNLGYAVLAAPFARPRRIRVETVEPAVLAVCRKPLSRAGAINRLHLRSPLMEVSNVHRVRGAATGGRAKPLVELAGANRKRRPANPTVMVRDRTSGTVLLSVTCLAACAAKLPTNVRADHFGAALDAGVLSCHARQSATSFGEMV